MKTKILLFILFIVAFFYRWPRIVGPMWTDEFSSANQALLWINYGFDGLGNPDVFLEPNNILTHWLLVPIRLFGDSAIWLRLPFMIIGSLLVPTVYVFTKKYVDQLTAIIASILAITSYSLITWSQQARGYALHQILILFWIMFFLQFLKKPSTKTLFYLLMIGLFGFLTHITFLVTILASVLYGLIFYGRDLTKIVKQHSTTLVSFLLIILAISWIIDLDNSIGYYFGYLKQVGVVNNLGYYHSFLWRSQTIVSIFAILGILFCIKNKYRFWLLAISIIFGYLFFFTFVFGPISTRYLVIFWPLLLIFMAVGIAEFSKLFCIKSEWYFAKYQPAILALITTLVIVGSGHWFTLKPKPYYSVNYFFREIAVLDYDQIYAPIVKEIGESEVQIGMIDTWKDRALWYLPEHTAHLAVFRWADAGLMKQSPYTMDEQNNKRLKQSERIRLIVSVEDLERYMQEYPIGYLYIDDNSLPKEVIEYAENNFKIVQEIDRYVHEPNVYAVWPAKLYRWEKVIVNNNIESRL